MSQKQYRQDAKRIVQFSEISSQVLVKPQQNATAPSPKILTGSSQNYLRVPEPGDNYIRPLMVNAWSQTTTNDFDALQQVEHSEGQTKRERELLEKIRKLESDLRSHAEVLSQIHATSARTSALLGQPAPPPFIKPLQIQTVESQSSNPHTSSRAIPEQLSNHNSPTSSVINPLHSTPKESVKYTIIAEGSGDVNGEPIEIQLAEDDGALNLNSSSDSGRLEICLAPEDGAAVKTESIQAPSIGTAMYNNGAMPTELNCIKKRKLGIYQNDALAQNSNYYFNERGVLLPSSNDNSKSLKKPPRKRRSGNSLLKPNKSGKVNGAPHIQTTPIQSLMPSRSHNTSVFTDPDRNANIWYDRDRVTVSLGPNDTRILAKVYENLAWDTPSIATRKLLMALFDREVLASHSMTGKPSPAFKDHGKPLKKMLNPKIIQDIIYCVTRRCNASEKEVRNAITTKCADENKMMKLQASKLAALKEMNKENIISECINDFKSEL